MTGSQFDEHLSNHIKEARVVYTHELPAGSGWIRQGSEEVEDGRNTKCFSNRHHVFRCRMVVYGETEADACFVHAFRLDGWIRIDVDSKSLQHLRGTSPGS